MVNFDCITNRFHILHVSIDALIVYQLCHYVSQNHTTMLIQNRFCLVRVRVLQVREPIESINHYSVT
jgi:hypothetical protein